MTGKNRNVWYLGVVLAVFLVVQAGTGFQFLGAMVPGVALVSAAQSPPACWNEEDNWCCGDPATTGIDCEHCGYFGNAGAGGQICEVTDGPSSGQFNLYLESCSMESEFPGFHAWAMEECTDRCDGQGELNLHPAICSANCECGPPMV